MLFIVAATIILFILQSATTLATTLSNPELLGWGSNFDGRLAHPILATVSAPLYLPAFESLASNNHSWNVVYGLPNIKTELSILTPMHDATVVVATFKNESNGNAIVGQTIYMSGDNSNRAFESTSPPFYISQFTVVLNYQKDYIASNPLKNKIITSMKCWYRCLMLTQDNLVFFYSLNASPFSQMAIPATFVDPVTSQTTTLIVQDVYIAGTFSEETYFILTTTGHVLSWGGDNNIRVHGNSATPTIIPQLTNIVSLSVNRYGTAGTAAAINSTGHVLVWGSGEYGGLGLGSSATIYTPTLLPLDYASAGAVTKIVLLNVRGVLMTLKRQVFAFGTNTDGEATGSSSNGGVNIYSPYNVTQIILNAASSAGLVGDISDIELSTKASFCKYGDAILSWGSGDENGRGVSGIGSITLPEPVDFFKSFYDYSLYSGKTTGRVYGFGSNNHAQMGYGDVKMVRYPTSLSSSGYYPFTSTDQVKRVALRAIFGCSYLNVIFSNGTTVLHNWGYCENYLSLASQTLKSISPPQAVNSSLYESGSIDDVQLSLTNGLILKSNGIVYGWGSKSRYQFGNDNSGFYSAPVNLFSSNPEFNATKIRVGTGYFAIQLNNGSIIVRGSNSVGNLGINPTDVKQFTILDTSSATLNDPIYDFSTCGETFYIVTQSGKVYGIGSNTNNFITGLSVTSVNTWTRLVFGSKQIIKVACGNRPLFLSRDGYVFIFSATPSQLVIPNNELIVDIDESDNVGKDYMLLKSNKHNLYTNGYNDFYQASPTVLATPIAGVVVSLLASGGKAPLVVVAGDVTSHMIRVDEWSCFGTLSSSDSVCSGRGFCIEPDTCRCFNEAFGSMCHIVLFYPPNSFEQKYVDRDQFPQTSKFKMSLRIEKYAKK